MRPQEPRYGTARDFDQPANATTDANNATRRVDPVHEAALIAAGVLEFPVDRVRSPTDPLALRIRDLRRRRLLAFLADVLARDSLPRTPPEGKGNNA